MEAIDIPNDKESNNNSNKTVVVNTLNIHPVEEGEIIIDFQQQQLVVVQEVDCYEGIVVVVVEITIIIRIIVIIIGIIIINTRLSLWSSQTEANPVVAAKCHPCVLCFACSFPDCAQLHL